MPAAAAFFPNGFNTEIPRCRRKLTAHGEAAAILQDAHFALNPFSVAGCLIPSPSL